MTREERLEAAHRQAAELRGFYSHLTLYVGVMLLLALLNSITGGPWWFWWPVVGWGVGVLGHASAVFGRRFWGAAWEERKVAELMAQAAPAPPLRAVK
jgi:hypothetical protein